MLHTTEDKSSSVTNFNTRINEIKKKISQPGWYPDAYSDFSFVIEIKPVFLSLLFLSTIYSLSLYPYYTIELAVV